MGLSHDTAGVVVSGVGPDGKLIVYVVRCWHGTRPRPIDLTAVEAEIEGFARRFHCTVHLDQWQGVLMQQRLQRVGIAAVVHTVESSRLDSYASLIKSMFAARMIRVPVDRELLEQLENLEAQEMRHDRLRFTSGPGQFDDLPMALCLSTESHLRWKQKDGQTRVIETDLGRVRMPEIDRCYARERTGDLWAPVRCPLDCGASAEVGCVKCAAFVFVSRLRDEHVKQGGEWAPLWAFAKRLRKNAIISDLEWQRIQQLW